MTCEICDNKYTLKDGTDVTAILYDGGTECVRVLKKVFGDDKIVWHKNDFGSIPAPSGWWQYIDSIGECRPMFKGCYIMSIDGKALFPVSEYVLKCMMGNPPKKNVVNPVEQPASCGVCCPNKEPWLKRQLNKFKD